MEIPLVLSHITLKPRVLIVPSMDPMLLLGHDDLNSKCILKSKYIRYSECTHAYIDFGRASKN